MNDINDIKPPKIVNLTNPSCVVFAEDNSSVANCEIIGALYIGFASYINSGFVRPYCEIGRYCSVGRDVSLGLGVHQHDTLSTSPFFQHLIDVPPKLASEKPKRRVIIGNDVWIGDGVKISSGVSIGDGCVIAAGSIVTRDVSPYSIIGGVPAKEIKKRFHEDIISELMKIKWWRLNPHLLKKISLQKSMEIYIKELEKIAKDSEIYELKYHTLRI